MPDRLSTLDSSFFYLEEPTTPMHVGGVLILQAPAGGADVLADLIAARLPLVPRYRQRVVEVPGRLADPVWVDDPDFDFDYHVRRSGLPRPGSQAQLLDLVSRLASRPLDRSRPLWEVYLVEGMAGDRVAVVTKTHPALVDGLGAIDIGQVLLDSAPEVPASGPVEWRPDRIPSGGRLLWDAFDEYVRRPSSVVEIALGAVGDVRATAARVTSMVGGVVRAARSTLLPAPHTPLNAPAGRQRRVAMARAELSDIKQIRKANGGTVNDVLMAVVTGALREWLLSRGEPVVAGTTVRALVPVSVQDPEDAHGGQVSSHFVDLPVGEPNPRVRLTRLTYAMRGITDQGPSIGADSLLALTGFAPPTLHALAAKAARGLSRRLFNLVVTNVPGPQLPLYAAGAEMLEVFPVVPLARGQGLAIGITSYNGRVYFGLNGDRDSVGDVEALAELLEQAVVGLVDSTG